MSDIYVEKDSSSLRQVMCDIYVEKDCPFLLDM